MSKSTKYDITFRDYLFSWTGNKDREIGTILEALSANGVDLANIDTVVEGFGGSFALIRYLIRSGMSGKKYIVYDIDSDLIDSYNLMKEEKTNAAACEELKGTIPLLTKSTYAASIKSGPLAYLIKNTIFAIRPGLFPLPVEGKPTKEPNYKRLAAFTKFNKVEFICEDFFANIDKYKDDPRALLFLDPPYFLSPNDFYLAGITNAIFTLIRDRMNYKCKILFVINDHLLTRPFIEACGVHITTTAQVRYSRSAKNATHIYFMNAPQQKQNPDDASLTRPLAGSSFTALRAAPPQQNPSPA